jgi:hypothetical protein
MCRVAPGKISSPGVHHRSSGWAGPPQPVMQMWKVVCPDSMFVLALNILLSLFSDRDFLSSCNLGKFVTVLFSTSLSTGK